MEKKERRIYLEMAAIGYKHSFKKAIHLAGLKIKRAALQIQYKTLEAKYKREIRKNIPKKKDTRKEVLKYLYIAALGILLFTLVSIPVERARGYRAIGGEGIFLLLPLLYLLGTSLLKGDGKK